MQLRLWRECLSYAAKGSRPGLGVVLLHFPGGRRCGGFAVCGLAKMAVDRGFSGGNPWWEMTVSSGVRVLTLG